MSDWFHDPPSDVDDISSEMSRKAEDSGVISRAIAVFSQSCCQCVTNVYCVVLMVFLSSIAVGIVFYTSFHGWEVSTAFYFSSQVLMGSMYGIPVEREPVSQFFTLGLFIWGTSLIACCHLIATSKDSVTLSKLSEPSTHYHSFWNFFFASQHTRLTAVLLSSLWLLLGTAHGLIFEKWTLSHSLYFALGAMSAAGVPAPLCTGGDDEHPLSTCQLGPLRGFGMGVYVMIGVPLFAFTIGLLAGFVVDSVSLANQRRLQSSASLHRMLGGPDLHEKHGRESASNGCSSPGRSSFPVALSLSRDSSCSSTPRGGSTTPRGSVVPCHWNDSISCSTFVKLADQCGACRRVIRSTGVCNDATRNEFDLKDFVILELFRRKFVTTDQLQEIRQQFLVTCKDSAGVQSNSIQMDELEARERRWRERASDTISDSKNSDKWSNRTSLRSWWSSWRTKWGGDPVRQTTPAVVRQSSRRRICIGVVFLCCTVLAAWVVVYSAESMHSLRGGGGGVLVTGRDDYNLTSPVDSLELEKMLILAEKNNSTHDQDNPLSLQLSVLQSSGPTSLFVPMGDKMEGQNPDIDATNSVIT